MAQQKPFPRIDPEQIERAQQAERSALHIRWWLIFPAVVLCAGQGVMKLWFENSGQGMTIIATQISAVAFAVLLFIACIINPLIRLFRFMKPFNRAEVMALFAAMFVTGGISTFGLVDQLVPLVAAPWNSQWDTPQRRWDKDVQPYLNKNLFITDVEALDQFRTGFPSELGAEEKPFGERLADHWERAKKVPWMMWAKPLAFWMIFIFAIYVVFYSISILVYDTWARREKLIFPLARLPENMIQAEGTAPGVVPGSVKTAAFWVGFLVVFIFLSYNGAAQAGWIRGMQPLSMGMNQQSLVRLLDGSIFQGIATGPWYHLRLSFVLIFTAIGIGFLLPLEISFSLWIYYLIGMGMLMVAIWMAFGASMQSFVTFWMWHNHFVTAMGGGGLLIFAAICLGRVLLERWSGAVEQAKARNAWAGMRTYLTFTAAVFFVAIAFVALVSLFGWRIPGLSHVTFVSVPLLHYLVLGLLILIPLLGGDEVRAFVKQALGPGGLLFLGGVVVAVEWLQWSGVPVFWGVGFLAVVLLVAIGLMRVTAEGGVFWYQIHTGPFHLANASGLVKWMAQARPELLRMLAAPLVNIYSVLFLDIKTYIAPAIVNSFRMQEETRASRRRFHLIVTVCILITVVVSTIFVIYIAYMFGADRMSGFFTSAPRSIVDKAQQLGAGKVASTSAWNWLWYIMGAGWVVLSVLMRRRFFWWLHPIGFVMLANPLTTSLWFNFFLGWICKKLAVKYGGRHQFTRLRPLFIGLIFGELMAVFAWALLKQFMDLEKVKIDINRMSP